MGAHVDRGLMLAIPCLSNHVDVRRCILPVSVGGLAAKRTNALCDSCARFSPGIAPVGAGALSNPWITPASSSEAPSSFRSLQNDHALRRVMKMLRAGCANECPQMGAGESGGGVMPLACSR